VTVTSLHVAVVTAFVASSDGDKLICQRSRNGLDRATALQQHFSRSICQCLSRSTYPNAKFAAVLSTAKAVLTGIVGYKSYINRREIDRGVTSNPSPDWTQIYLNRSR
jgi:hypothetical protein